MNPENPNTPEIAMITGNKLVLVILGISFVMGAVLTLTVLQMSLTTPPSAIAAPQSRTQSQVSTPDALPESPAGEHTSARMVPLNSFVVTLNEAGEPRYLKISLSAEVTSADTQMEIQQRNAEIRDSLIPYFSSLSLKMTQGIRGKQRIRKQAAEHINSVLTSGSVNRVFISEFITQ